MSSCLMKGFDMDSLTTFIDTQLIPFDDKIMVVTDNLVKDIQKFIEQYIEIVESSNLSEFEMKDYRKDIAALKYFRDDLNGIVRNYNNIKNH